MTTQTAKAFAIIKSKFTGSATSWRVVAVVKTTDKSVFIPGSGWKGNPDRIEMERVVAFVPTQERGEEIAAKAKEVERAHQEEVSKAQMAAAEVEAKEMAAREAAIQEARRVYDIATRETKTAVWEAAQAQKAAVAAFVAAEVEGA